MTSRPWMPLYVADYRHDTAHLSAAEHGAYLLLIMHYWTAGALPDDNRQLARIASMTAAEWRRARPTVQAFFHNGWKHKRIDAELAHAEQVSSKRRAAAMQKHGNSPANAPANAELLHTHARASPPSQSQHSEPDGSADVVGEDPKARLFRLGKTILVSFGIAEKRTGSLIGQWLKAKNDPAGLLAAIQFARNQNVAEPVAYVSAIVSGKGKQNGGFGALASAADDLIARAEKRGVEDAAVTIDVVAGRG